MSKSNILNEDGQPIVLLPSKSDSVYPAPKGKKIKQIRPKPVRRSTLSFGNNVTNRSENYGCEFL